MGMEQENTQIETAAVPAERKLKGLAKNINKPDIRYRGPLNYRALRILGWLCFALSSLGMVVTIYFFMKGQEMTPAGKSAKDIFESLKEFFMPLLLLANFSLILRARKSYKSQLMLYGILTGAIMLAYYVFILRYTYAIAGLISETPEEANEFVTLLLFTLSSNGLNVFLDLFLCTLFAFFVNYKPQKFFVGKKLILFRLFAVLIFLYQVGCFAARLCQGGGLWVIPVGVYPLLTSKSIVCFLAFAAIVLYVKFRERRFIRGGGTEEEYEAYLLTNRNALGVSVFIAIAFFGAALLDFIALIPVIGITHPEYSFWWWVATDPLGSGIGAGISLALVAPIALLFNYTKEPKNRKLDKFVPLAGIALLILVILEGIYYVLTHLPKA